MTACEPVRIPFEDSHLDGLLELPESEARESVVLLAHGSGAGMESGFLGAMSRLLAERGFAVLRFEYPYMQRVRATGRRRPPDPRETLERAHRAAVDEVVRRFPRRRLLLAGKSLGGRIASYLAAEDTDGGHAAGLVFLGYPLHPSGRPEKLRCDHFAILTAPALFLQGTRDALCELPLLEDALAGYGGAATLEVIEGADHGFDMLRRSGRSGDEVRVELADAIARWEAATFPR